MRVLLADDHVLVREGVRRSLLDAGDIEVVGEAGDGAEAVELARELLPDVVIMDVAMPRLNGIQATRQIKAMLPTVAVLVLTAYDEEEYITSLLDAGAAGYLMKTASSEELVHAVRSVYVGEAVLDPAVTKKFLTILASSRRDRANGAGALHQREREVLRLAARGLTNRAIGQQLGLSPRTVQDHLEHIFGKLKVGSRTEAVARALVSGLIGPEDLQ